MQFKSMILAAAMVTGLAGAPATAALQTLNLTGNWVQIDPLTTWSAADAITMHVVYDDSALLAGFTDRYDLTAAGSELTFTVGAESWMLVDFFASPAFFPAPFVDFSQPTGPEVYFLGINGGFTAAMTGIDLLPYGYPPGTILLSPIGDAFAAFSSIATFLPVGGVPEPASWAMLIAGFGLTGAAMRRRRQVAA